MDDCWSFKRHFRPHSQLIVRVAKVSCLRIEMNCPACNVTYRVMCLSYVVPQGGHYNRRRNQLTQYYEPTTYVEFDCAFDRQRFYALLVRAETRWGSAASNIFDALRSKACRRGSRLNRA